MTKILFLDCITYAYSPISHIKKHFKQTCRSKKHLTMFIVKQMFLQLILFIVYLQP